MVAGGRLRVAGGKFIVGRAGHCDLSGDFAIVTND